MYQALIILHVLLAAGIITLVLLQQGRGADAGAAFGSGASGTVFGAQGSASFLTRTTAVLATLFFATSLGLAMLGDTRKSVEGFMDVPVEQSAPVDLPTDQSENYSAPASDIPELPPAANGSANGEVSGDQPASSPEANPTVHPEDQVPNEPPKAETEAEVPAE
jgi:preprotein translocase subunit SecG